MPDGPRGLYAITPDIANPDALLALLEPVLAAGVDALQFRVKPDEPAAAMTHTASARRAEAGLRTRLALRALAEQVKQRCDVHRVPLIINDDVDLACELEARGVHIGRDDGDPRNIRRRIGPTRWLGVSCYNDLERALHLKGVADHVGFGSVFASPTKPAAVRAPLALFGQAAAHGLHAVGIGGIDRTNAADVIAAGAQAVAIITDLFADPHPAQAAVLLRERITRAAPPPPLQPDPRRA
jgi:thiamine-phosphate pyrophosphorylase